MRRSKNDQRFSVCRVGWTPLITAALYHTDPSQHDPNPPLMSRQVQFTHYSAHPTDTARRDAEVAVT